MGWNVDGIVDEAFRALVYNAPSETLLAQSSARRQSATSSNPSTNAGGSRPSTGSSSALTSSRVRGVVAAEAVPVAYFLIWTHGRTSPEGADWKALARIDLEALSVTEVITGFTGEWDGAWISQLQAVSADATSLFCTVG